MPNLKVTFLAIGLALSFSLPATEIASCANYDVYVMRHLPKVEGAEQRASNKDPELNVLGQKMAHALADSDFMAHVDVGFSTDYQRTKQTLKPSAIRHDFDIHLYDPGDNQALVDVINTQHCGKTVVIVGHSNTTPAIVMALGGTFEVSFGGQSLPENTQVQLDESDYGRVFQIKKVQSVIEQKMFRLKP